ncbi:hypothetical protein FQR65_LT10089 [Abscondita terminalis]|nr:hypothetical protein FQR65_LT10089 [Abscondita terminalis]
MLLKRILLIKVALLVAKVASLNINVGELPPEIADEFQEIPEIWTQNTILTCPNRIKTEVKFYLYNRAHRDSPLELNADKTDVKDKKLIILIHGWLTSYNTSQIQDLKNAYLQKYDCNVLMVDWSKATMKPYKTAYCHVGVVSHYDVHIVGHSTGSHVAGLTGQLVQSKCKGKIRRITALDPPDALGTQKLSKTIAEFLDVIHTDTQRFGTRKVYGHVDYFVNCGWQQPGCKNFVKVLSNDSLTDVMCNHMRSIELMTESVNSPNSIAVSCYSCPRYCRPDILTETYRVMGEQALPPPPSRTNIFLLPTGDSFPYFKVKCHDGMKMRDLEPNTAEELRKIVTNKEVVANCTNHPRPQKPNYILYKRNNPDVPITVTPSNIKEIEKDKKTIFFIPGWLTSPNTSVVLSLKDAYFKRYDCNFIIVDWSQNAYKPYSYLYCDVRTTALDVADFMCALNRLQDIELKDVHVIGHSFGGHVAGFLGKYTDLECDQSIGRVTGLDAAGQLFRYKPVDDRLSEKDALFVDVIHTDFQFGILQNCGVMDFHVNCVYGQKACPKVSITDDTLVSDVYCPSILSIILFTESINSNQLIAVSCGLCSRNCEPDIINEIYTLMGEDCRGLPGPTYIHNFLIYTRDSPPYGMGMTAYPKKVFKQ